MEEHLHAVAHTGGQGDEWLELSVLLDRAAPARPAGEFELETERRVYRRTLDVYGARPVRALCSLHRTIR